MLMICAWITTLAILSDAATWQSAQATLPSRWSREASADNPHPDYPRPQMVRSE